MYKRQLQIQSRLVDRRGVTAQRAGQRIRRSAGLVELLAARGLEVGPRGRSTLVAWKAADPEAEVARLAENGLVVRSIPSHGLVRVSVGAWSSEDELARLAELARA